MIKIIDRRGTGKTLNLILQAKENSIIVCQNPAAMKEKVEHGYGIVGLNYLSYLQYIQYLQNKSWDSSLNDRDIYIDEVSTFLSILDHQIAGYTESIGDY